MPIDYLSELEAKISRLLEKHLRLKREKEVVEKRLLQKESEFRHLILKIRKYEKERGEFRDKLETILDHFEGLDLTEGRRG
jgi:hypothetical protein